jgi:hypothetical protein
MYDLSQKTKDSQIEVYLTLNSVEYKFTHKNNQTAEVKKIGKLIGQSIDLMLESKYKDIAQSRKQEILKLFKKLTTVSSFSKEQYKEVEIAINSFNQD